MNKETISSSELTPETTEDHYLGEFAESSGFGKGDFVQSIGLESLGIKDDTTGEVIMTEWNNGRLIKVELKLDTGTEKLIKVGGEITSLHRHFLKIDQSVDDQTTP